jgi:hypothetical protein
MLWVAPLLFGIGATACVGLSLLSGERANVRVATGALCMWAVANLLWLNNGLVFMPLLDWLLGLMAMAAWLDEPRRWAGRVVLICYLRLAAHVVDQMTAQTLFVAYAHVLNALFAALLWAIAEPGGRNGAHRIREFWRAGRRRHSLRPACREVPQ